jgi:ubiquinone/menaquinone biosynthesis C-methylase UbiE
MSWYERTVFNPLLETALQRQGVRDMRARVLAPARGDILEIGLGTGMNLPFYPEHVRRLASLSPDAELDPRARARAEERSLDIEHHPGSASGMPFADESFDTVVSTLVLCTVPEPALAVREIARVLRPGGQLLFFEHVVSENRLGRGLQRVLDPVMRRINCGCSLLRDTAPTIADAGFTMVTLQEERLADMAPLYRRVIWGVAARA